jgi:hypothetical protein
MSIFDPRQPGSGAEPDSNRERDDAPLPTRFGRTGSGAEPDSNRERDDAPLPTRFGRDRRRRQQRPQPNSAPRHTTGEPRAGRDDARPFDDDGGL